MLKLINISKDYIVGNSTTNALRGINIAFRKCEFVSILGPSGCGKTTLLNLIGGLDKVTSGEMVVSGVSTKEYDSMDWDKYRNNKIGFVFQSYNLIPHQTIFSNVELSLTLSGISKEQRKERVTKALGDVGLGDQLYKKPNQLSGGQMQRVAIARALVNNPEIILADEPTGALDSDSGEQVMELLKEVAKDRLVIMVTHNEVLAQEYSTRIIKLSDGEVIFDSNPYKEARAENADMVLAATKKRRRWFKLFKKRDKAMTMRTALALSLNNLISKKGRSFLTSLAGSIGIIGICLVLALSAGVRNYVETMEKDALSLYPLEIQETNVNVNSILSMLSDDTSNRENYPDSEVIYTKKVIGNVLSNILNIISTNDLESFKTYLDENFDDSLGYVKYDYGTNFNVYCNYVEDDLYMKVSPFIEGMNEVLGDFSNLLDNVSSFAAILSVWDEMIDNQELLEQQYELVGQSKWPENMNEVVVVVDEKNQLDDYSLFAIGLKSEKEIMDALNKDSDFSNSTFTVDELLGIEYKVMTNADYYYLDEENGQWKVHNPRKRDIEFVDENSITVNVVGVVRPKEGAVSASINGMVGYTSELTEYMISLANNHPAAIAQKNSPNTNIIDGSEINSRELKELLLAMGVADIDVPKAIRIFSYSFEDKDLIKAFIADYNRKADKVIKYSDTLEIIMGYVDTFTKTVTGVLIGFSAISLIVSSIMIAIIIYTSILERRKEIGVLRSLGASKKDVSDVFIAESAILGVTSGLIGVLIAIILTIPVNFILFSMFSVSRLAIITWWHVVLMVGISLILSVLAGFIPSRIAAKQDPVEALRTE